MKIKNTITFAFYNALLISVFSVSIFSFIFYLKFQLFDLKSVLITAGILFISILLFINERVKSFVLNRVRKIYEDVTISDSSNPQNNFSNTDLETLSLEVQKFAENKQQEIETLNERENYRREFLGNVSHELKTPLFTVQGYLLTLIEGAADDKDIRDRYLERANIGVERLASIVKDLDMISKLESNDMYLSLEPFNILEVIQNIFNLFEMKVKKKNMTLRFDKLYEFPIYVIADAAKIEQVIINLIENSIKYGKFNGIIMVTIENSPPNKILVKVEDNGEGIKKENLNRVFERFYRVDKSRSRDQGGSGLGLSIVKHIVEAHKEKISLKSEYGKGSTFSFTLKRAN